MPHPPHTQCASAYSCQRRVKHSHTDKLPWVYVSPHHGYLLLQWPAELAFSVAHWLYQLSVRESCEPSPAIITMEATPEDQQRWLKWVPCSKPLYGATEKTIMSVHTFPVKEQGLPVCSPAVLSVGRLTAQSKADLLQLKHSDISGLRS